MAKTRQQKAGTISALTDKLGRMKTVVFSSFSGLTVKEVTELRRTLRASEVDYLVSKKTLLRRALTEVKLDPGIADQLEGGVALTFGYADEVGPAKMLQTYAKTHPALTFVGGIVNGTWLSAAEISALAKLPTREELLAQTVWMIKSPLTGLASVLTGNIRSFLNVLQALKDKQPSAV